MPFGGPEVPFNTYTDWFIEHGIVFSVFMGIGQRIAKQNASLPDCCYYLHCPTYEYPVIPMATSDELNAEARLEHYVDKVDHRLYLILSATFPNLQRSGGAAATLMDLWHQWPKTFTWMGELNVFKHALAGNGFFSNFTGPRLTVERVEDGELDALFGLVGPPRLDGEHIGVVTLHSDMGCDSYAKAIPAHAGDGVHELVCETPVEEMRVAQGHAAWWKQLLGDYYSAFFDDADYPKRNFRKVMHLHVLDAIISRYPRVKFVWAHLGLCMELTTLHPAVHAHILRWFYEKHATNLWSDMSWDVLAKMNYMNFDGRPIDEMWSAAASDDLPDDSLWDARAVAAERERLEAIWQYWKPRIGEFDTSVISGPTYKMAVLLSLIHKYPERFITGTDFVASFGTHKDFPGYTPLTGAPLSPITGCHKEDFMHSEQVTDTSSLNMFFDDETFSAVVLGGNFFHVAGISTTYAAPPICRDDQVGELTSTTPTPGELSMSTMRIAAAAGTDAPAAAGTAASAEAPTSSAGPFYFAVTVATLALLAAGVRTYVYLVNKRGAAGAKGGGASGDGGRTVAFGDPRDDDGPDYMAFGSAAAASAIAPPGVGPPGIARFGSKVCEHCQPLRHETNVIVLHRLDLLHKLASINLALALASILYFAIGLVLLTTSLWPTPHVVDGGAFHLLDFGGAFFFSLIEVLTLLCSPERRFTSPTLLRILMFFSMCSTSVALLFMSLNRHAFEVLAHNINYVNDFTVALVDSLLVSTVVRSPVHHPGLDALAGGTRGVGSCATFGKQIAVVATFVPLGVSFGQVMVYNLMGVDAQGKMLGEGPAHVLEFLFTMMSASISFWFCLDSKMLAEELTRQIMIAPDELVVVLDPTSKTSVHTADECGRSPRLHAGQPVLSPCCQSTGCCEHEHDTHDHNCSHVHDHACAHGPPSTSKPRGSMLTELLLPPSASSN